MKKPVIFSGTSEGRLLAKELAEMGVPSVVCVASSYGREVMDESELTEIHVGRMDSDAMTDFLKAEAAGSVIDATHPFAVEVSSNIRQACQRAGLTCLRLLREQTADGSYGDNVTMVDSQEECVKELMKTKGNILVTTGSKEVGLYGADPKLRQRVTVRVLPAKESIALCRRAGFCDEQIIAARGPFSRQENIRDIREHGISLLVTKESGLNGGLKEKLEAAAETGTGVYMIRRPEESGLGYYQVLERIKDGLNL